MFTDGLASRLVWKIHPATSGVFLHPATSGVFLWGIGRRHGERAASKQRNPENTAKKLTMCLSGVVARGERVDPLLLRVLLLIMTMVI